MIFAIDPGNTKSGWVIIDSDLRPINGGKDDNETVLGLLDQYAECDFVIEMVASYGMSVGASVFETCVWIGRFYEAAHLYNSRNFIFRMEEKINLCHDSRAKDTNVRQALIDRFAQHDTKRGKGTKDKPDWFYGFSADQWQAYAVGVTWADKQSEVNY